MSSGLNKKASRLTLIMMAGLIAFLAFGNAIALASPFKGKRSQARGATLDRIFELSGVRDTAKYLDNQVFGHHLDQPDLPAGQVRMIQNIMARVYEPEEWIQTVRQHVLKSYKPQYMDALFKWYESPLGQRIVQEEVASMGGGMTNEKKEFLQRLKYFPPREERLEMAEQLEATIGWTDHTLDTFLIFIRILFPLNDQFKGESGKAITKRIREELYDPAREYVLKSILYSYRDLSDEEFYDYVQFMGSREGKWFLDSYLKGSKDAFEGIARKVEKLIEVILEDVSAGNGESELLDEIIPAGQRYLFVRKRDPFIPLVDPQIGLIPVDVEDDSQMEFRKFSEDLKNLPPIPMEVYRNLKRANPRLYADLEYYGDLFRQETKVASMEQEDYINAVEKYRDLIQKANETKSDLILSPIQTDYESISLVGVLWKNKQKLALIETADKKGHTVREGDLLGPNFGVVETIDHEEINVLEQSRDYLGNILSRKKEIELIKGSQEEG